jgi:NAD(P) transhydrogenase
VRVRREGAADRALDTEIVLLAPGTHPYRPPEIPFADPDVDDSDEVLEVPSIPHTFVVVGGGVIGCEYASIYAALGITKVTLIEKSDRLLSFLDREMGDALTEALRRLGVEVILNDRVTEFGKRADGTGVKIKLASGRVMEVDRLLAASGRQGNTRNMGLEEAGVHLNERGLVKVNSHFQTSVPNIYAAGDVVGFPALASTSMEQGRLAMSHAFHKKQPRKIAELFPMGIYTIPEISCVGLSEDAARQKYPDVEIGRARYSENVRGQIINDANGMLKLVFRAGDRKLLGVHIIGERATELIHTGQAVLALGGTLDYFLDFVFNYPTLTETYKNAAYDGVSRLGPDHH